VRLQAATALNNVPGQMARAALLATLKDAKSAVRARAVASLASSKDAGLAPTYQQLLNDQSYAVIKAAALALGQTKSPIAYDSLVKLLDVPSWRDTIRVSALAGLGALGDKRAVNAGIKYAGRENLYQVRTAAIRLLGSTGKDDPRVFPIVAEALNHAVEKGEFTMGIAAAETLANLGDARAVPILERVAKEPGELTRLAPMFAQLLERLRKGTSSGRQVTITTDQPRPDE
jgi:HEAT repeat protein